MGLWKHSDLVVGESVRIPKELFVEGGRAERRLIVCRYIGETDAGIIVDCIFKSPLKTGSPEENHYRMMINWASIFCGAVVVHRIDGSMVRAIRNKDVSIKKRTGYNHG